MVSISRYLCSLNHNITLRISLFTAVPTLLFCRAVMFLLKIRAILNDSFQLYGPHLPSLLGIYQYKLLLLFLLNYYFSSSARCQPPLWGSIWHQHYIVCCLFINTWVLRRAANFSHTLKLLKMNTMKITHDAEKRVCCFMGWGDHDSNLENLT